MDLNPRQKKKPNSFNFFFFLLRSRCTKFFAPFLNVLLYRRYYIIIIFFQQLRPNKAWQPECALDALWLIISTSFAVVVVDLHHLEWYNITLLCTILCDIIVHEFPREFDTTENIILFTIRYCARKYHLPTWRSLPRGKRKLFSNFRLLAFKTGDRDTITRRNSVFRKCLLYIIISSLIRNQKFVGTSV